MKSKPSTILVSSEHHNKLKELAAYDKRTLRAYIEVLIDALPCPTQPQQYVMQSEVEPKEVEPKEAEPLIWDPNVGEHVDRMPEDGDANARPLTPENQIRNDALAAASKKEAARVKALTPEQRAAELQAHLDEWV